jgi:Disulphide bond corrector protein DsbC
MKLKFFYAAVLMLCAFGVSAQQKPVKWSFNMKDAGNGEFDIVMTGAIDEGFYTYSQFLESEDGPIPTTVNFEEGAHFKLVGKAKESGEIIKVYDKVFGMNLTKFKHKAVFTQRVKVIDATKPIKGYVNYMVCTDEMCLPPSDAEFSLKPPASSAPAPTPAKDGSQGNVAPPVFDGQADTR